MKCPNCHTSNIGTSHTERYYCWNCMIVIDARNDTFEALDEADSVDQRNLEDLFADDFS